LKHLRERTRKSISKSSSKSRERPQWNNDVTFDQPEWNIDTNLDPETSPPRDVEDVEKPVVKDTTPSQFYNPSKYTENDPIYQQIEQPSISEPREPCPECGRKFILSSLQKHVKHCKKVFKKKRPEFNSQSKRGAIQGDGKVIPLNTGVKWGKSKKKKEVRPKKKSWKNQSSQLRNAMRAARMYAEAEKNGVPVTSLPSMPAVEDTRVPCPHCGRKFNEEVANRHIPKCKNIINKPKTLRRRRE